MDAKPKLKVRVYPFREKLAHGNIIWAERDRGSAYYRVSRFAANNGRFPATHPVAPSSPLLGESDSSMSGSSDALTRFRERGYWASCFPEGDGITWKPLRGQSDETCFADIRECFPDWDIRVAQL